MVISGQFWSHFEVVSKHFVFNLIQFTMRFSNNWFRNSFKTKIGGNLPRDKERGSWTLVRAFKNQPQIKKIQTISFNSIRRFLLGSAGVSGVIRSPSASSRLTRDSRGTHAGLTRDSCVNEDNRPEMTCPLKAIESDSNQKKVDHFSKGTDRYNKIMILISKWKEFKRNQKRAGVYKTF